MLASLYKHSKKCYVKEKIDESWEKVLLNQCKLLMFNFSNFVDLV